MGGLIRGNGLKQKKTLRLSGKRCIVRCHLRGLKHVIL